MKTLEQLFIEDLKQLLLTYETCSLSTYSHTVIKHLVDSYAMICGYTQVTGDTIDELIQDFYKDPTSNKAVLLQLISILGLLEERKPSTPTIH